jgi:hypothetical protein
MVFTEDIDVRIEPPEGMDVKTGKNHTKPAHIKSRADFLSLADEDDQDRRYRVGRTRYFGQWFIMVTSWRRKAGFVTDGAIAIRETGPAYQTWSGGKPLGTFFEVHGYGYRDPQEGPYQFELREDGTEVYSLFSEDRLPGPKPPTLRWLRKIYGPRP